MTTATVTRPDAVTVHLMSEAKLWTYRDSSDAARHELVQRYSRMAHALARRYRSTSNNAEDLTQVALEGLVNAINRFDPDRGTNFAAFARVTIEGELKRFFRDRVWMVRLPRKVQENIYKCDRAADDLAMRLQRPPSVEEIAGYVGIDAVEVEEAVRGKASRQVSSMDASLNEDELPGSELIGEPDPRFESVDDLDQLKQTISVLDDTAKRVLRLRFVEDKTQQEIANRVGYSQMHVSRILKQSLEAMSDNESA